MKPFITVVTLCSILVTVFAPPELKVIAVFLLFYTTGFAIVFFTLPQKDIVDQIILSILTGLAFQIVYVYVISLVYHFSLLSLVIPCICLSVAVDLKGMYNFEMNKKAFLIFVPAVLFGVLTLNAVPGEDAIAHLLITTDIAEAAAIPQTYSLYPEIPVLMYPLGFHSITAQLQVFTGIDTLIFGVASFLSGVLCLSVYLCTKKLFSVECGLLAGTLSVFATVPPLNSLILSNYTTLLAYIFTCAAMSVIVDMTDTNVSVLLLSLILAAGVETHLLFFVIVLPLLVLIVVVNSPRRAVLISVYALGLGALMSAPFLARLLTGYQPYQMTAVQYIIEQEHHFFLQFTPDMIPQSVGVWITLVGVLGFLFLDKYRLFFGTWIGIFLFLAVNTVLKIEFPLWYAFFAPRMVDQLFLPLSILGAFFFTQIWKFSKVGVIILCGVLLVSGGLHVVTTPKADRGDLFPTTSPFFETDQQGMLWLLTTDEDATILNEWWTGTGSAWIPPLTRRKVIFPYTVNAFSVNVYTLDDYVATFDLPEKERKSFVIAAFPDSEEAYNYLQELNVDYIFLSSYVLEESKWRSALWNPFVLTESPNYERVFQEGYTYIFEVAPQFTYTTTFVLKNFGDITVNPDTPVHLDVSLTTSFPVDTVLDIYVEDVGFDSFEMRADNALLAVVPLTDTKESVHVAFRITNVSEVTISTKNQPVKMTARLSTALHDTIYYDKAALVGTWEKTETGYTLMTQGHIYLFNTSDTVEITYLDTGEGNVDFNVFANNEWQKLTTVYRENDGEVKTILLTIPGGYSLLDIGMNNWGDPFVVIGIFYPE